MKQLETKETTILTKTNPIYVTSGETMGGDWVKNEKGEWVNKNWKP